MAPGFPGGRGPNQPTQFVIPPQKFADGVVLPVGSSDISQIDVLDRRDIQGGYSTVPNLLLTTLALFAADSQLIKREAVLFQAKPAPSVQVFQPNNLLTSTLGVQVVNIPPGVQSCASAPSYREIGEALLTPNGLLMPAQAIAPTQETGSAPPNQNQIGVQPVQSRALLDFNVQPLPAGQQSTQSAPPTPSVLFWDKGTNTLLFITPPAGAQRTDSAPSVVSTSVAPTGSNFLALAPAAQPIPVGGQQTASIPIRPSAVKVDQPENVLAQFPPALSPLPIGTQWTESAPPAAEFHSIDQPINLLGSVLGYQPIASAQSEYCAPLDYPEVFSWVPPNLVIRVVVAANPLPVGVQWTVSAPTWTPPVQTFQQSNNALVVATVQALPVGEQQTESATKWNAPVQSYEAPNATLFIPAQVPIPIGYQQTASAPIWVVPIGTSVGWTIPPDLLPPAVITPDVVQQPAGKKRHDRYIARFKGNDYVFQTLEGLEEFVAWAYEAEKPKPKKYRKPVKIRLTPEFKEEASQFTEIPATIYQLPASKALAQVRLIEARFNDEEDDAEWLILIA